MMPVAELRWRGDDLAWTASQQRPYTDDGGTNSAAGLEEDWLSSPVCARSSPELRQLRWA